MENVTNDISITNLVERYGWKWKKTAEGQVVTGFQGLTGSFLLGFELKHDWLVIFTIDYLPKVSEEKSKEVYHLLLEYNADYPYVRFAKTAEGIILLVVDVAIKVEKKIDFDTFRMAMDIISEIADRSYPSLYEKITGTALPSLNQEQA